MSTNYVPAIKARMGDWTYYITKMKFGEVAKQVELAGEIHPNKNLDDLIQRELTNRVGSMTEFLLSEAQHFYGALVVAIYKGNPVFHPIKIDEGHGIVDKVNHSFGLLQMDGSQTYFALDGQHRLESIKAACKDNPDLKDEEISVLVIKHDESKEGLIRTRRLFTKLNRYAKPTDSKTNIAIDEDDCIAIVTRRLVRELQILKKVVKIDATGKQLNGAKDAKYLTTLSTLYECNLEISKSFRDGTNMDKEFLAKRPEDEYLDDLTKYLSDIWSELISGIDHLKRICIIGEKAGDFRVSTDGSIWVRPVFQLIAAEIIKRAILNKKNISEIVKSLSKLPSSLDAEPWVHVLWNPGTKRIVGAKAERAFMVEFLCVFLNLSTSSHTKKDLKLKYGAYFNQGSKEFPKI